MSDNLRFSIEFYKTRKHIDISKELTIDEKHEAVEQACFMIESLVFFVTDWENLDDLDGDSLGLYQRNVRQIIGGFVKVVLGFAGEIENRRNELEEIVKQIPNRK